MSVNYDEYSKEQIEKALSKIKSSKRLFAKYEQCNNEEEREKFILIFCMRYFDEPVGISSPCSYCVHAKMFPKTDKCTFYLDGTSEVHGLLDKLLDDAKPLENRCEYYEKDSV